MIFFWIIKIQLKYLVYRKNYTNFAAEYIINVSYDKDKEYF